MRNQSLFSWLGCCLAAIVLTTGCSGETFSEGDTNGQTGSLSLELDVNGEAKIDEVWYRITGNAMPDMTGFIDTSAPGATASVEVFGLPAGFGYLVELRAIADDGTSCRGSAPFDVRAGEATSVGVMINCKPRERFGSVRVNGTLNVCAHLEKVVVSPLQTSVGYTIDLSALGADAEEDSLAYFWSASGGPIDNPTSPVAQYTCAIPGRHQVRIDVSDDDFLDCIDSWTVEVQCVGDGGGSGGAAGGGGAGGTGGSAPECAPSQSRCQNGDIDAVEEDPACMLSEPPNLPNSCSGSESVVNPVSCSPTGMRSRYEVQMIAVASDCNAGFDLDRCDGESCINGGLAPGEGLDGVDNALTGLAPVLAGVGGNLGGVDQALYDGLCDGSIDWAFEIDANLAENCASVTPFYDGEAAASVILNLSSSGCISGTLGSMPLPLGGVEGALGNATLRGTADATSGFDLELGGTADAATAVAIAEALLEGAGAVVSQVFDINEDLSDDLQAGCNALSLTFDVAAVAGGSAEGACTNPDDAAVYADLVYTNGAGAFTSGPDAAAEIASDCVFGALNSDPRNPGCPAEAQAVLICAGGGCPPETVDTLSNCVQSCTQELIEEVTGDRLTADCADCYGESVSCTASLCATSGCSNPSSPSCVQCRCENDCTPGFDRCSGLLPSGECSGSGGTGGTGGTAGTGGTGGECLPAITECSNGFIDPIVPDPGCMLDAPPTLSDACAGTESVVNPSSCTATGVQSLYAVQALSTVGDCNVGFDLDGCNGSTCVSGGLSPGEGVDGVDNAVTGLAPILAGVGGNLGGLDQAYYDGLCNGSIDWQFSVDINTGENCATVTPIYGGAPLPPIPMNLSNTGCISGELGSLPLTIAGVEGAFGNGTIRGTVDATLGFNFLMGATVEAEGAIAAADAILPGAGAVVGQTFDINSSLQRDTNVPCNALSLSVNVGATVVPD